MLFSLQSRESDIKCVFSGDEDETPASFPGAQYLWHESEKFIDLFWARADSLSFRASRFDPVLTCDFDHGHAAQNAESG
jgi:hypothetical protein